MGIETVAISRDLLNAPEVKRALWTEILRTVAVPYAADCGLQIDPASIQLSADCSRIEPVPGYAPAAEPIPVEPLSVAAPSLAEAMAAVARVTAERDAMYAKQDAECIDWTRVAEAAAAVGVSDQCVLNHCRNQEGIKNERLRAFPVRRIGRGGKEFLNSG